MPYLRLYSPDLPISRKRVIAQKLIEITLRTFHLPAEGRYSITIQFIPLPQLCAVPALRAPIPSDADSTLEVNDGHLSEERKNAFAEEARAMLARVLPSKPKARIARLFGMKADSARQVALQFNEIARGDYTADGPWRSDFWPRAA
jgi:hypothetical protein